MLKVWGRVQHGGGAGCSGVGWGGGKCRGRGQGAAGGSGRAGRGAVRWQSVAAGAGWAGARGAVDGDTKGGTCRQKCLPLRPTGGASFTDRDSEHRQPARRHRVGAQHGQLRRRRRRDERRERKRAAAAVAPEAEPRVGRGATSLVGARPEREVLLQVLRGRDAEPEGEDQAPGEGATGGVSTEISVGLPPSLESARCNARSCSRDARPPKCL